MSQTVYSGHKCSQHFPPSILHCVFLLPIRYTITTQPSALLCTLLKSLVDCTDFQGAFLQMTAKPSYTAYYFETLHNLLQNYSVLFQHQRGSLIYLISHWKFRILTVYITQGKHTLLEVLARWIKAHWSSLWLKFPWTRCSLPVPQKVVGGLVTAFRPLIRNGSFERGPANDGWKGQLEFLTPSPKPTPPPTSSEML